MTSPDTTTRYHCGSVCDMGKHIQRAGGDHRQVHWRINNATLHKIEQEAHRRRISAAWLANEILAAHYADKKESE